MAGLRGRDSALLSRRDAHVRIVCATHGETGSMNPAVVTARADLAAVRAAEFAAACRHLGASEADLLDFPDGSLSWADVTASKTHSRRYSGGGDQMP